MLTNKKLSIKFSARTVQHLGVDMYQNAPAVISEFIANSFDAGADNVWIDISDTSISIKDDGIGMTFSDCEEKFLHVGYDKRREPNSSSTRPVMGRKGIGKFAGFGIAKRIMVESVSKISKEKTVFQLDLNDLKDKDLASENNKCIDVLEYEENSSADNGTTIKLEELQITPRQTLSKSILRRFCLVKKLYGFRMFFNGTEIPEENFDNLMEYSFPRDYKSIPVGISITDDGFAEEFLGENKILWKISFFKDPTPEPELKGVSVYSRCKIAQLPFFFDVGPTFGQHGLSYMTGQVVADYIDNQDLDVISPERQRIKWDTSTTRDLHAWGKRKIKELLKLWAEKRAEKRIAEISEKQGALKEEIDKLPSESDREVVKKAIQNLAKIETITKPQLEEIGKSIIIAKRQNRVKSVIDKMASMDNPSESELLEILKETNIVNALIIQSA